MQEGCEELALVVGAPGDLDAAKQAQGIKPPSAVLRTVQTGLHVRVHRSPAVNRAAAHVRNVRPPCLPCASRLFLPATHELAKPTFFLFLTSVTSVSGMDYNERGQGVQQLR